MARVLIPVMPRSYNYNPKGSATTHVTLAGDNPFERQTVIVNKSRSYIPGLGALGAEAPALTWQQQIAQAAIQTGTQVGTQLATNAINKILPPNITALPTTSAVPMQIVSANYVPAKPSKMPWIIGGSVLLLGIGAFFVLRKKRK